jgi:hypothetical protein
MANLLGQNIGTNYKGILNLDTINTPLDATLRAVTDGEGNASPLQLSTDSVSLGGATGANWDNTNKRLGIGTNTPSVTFDVVGVAKIKNDLDVQGAIYNGNSGILNLFNLCYVNGVNSRVGIGVSTGLTSRLHIKGSGTDASHNIFIGSE